MISFLDIERIVILINLGKVNAQVYLKLLQGVIIPEGKRLIGHDFYTTTGQKLLEII